MNSHTSWYNRYRPQNWGDVTGQDAVVAVLRQAVLQNRLVGAYLFEGPRGTGKTSCARILARAATCLHPFAGSACCGCDACTTNAAGQRGSDIVELDAASHGRVADARQLSEVIQYEPAVSLRRVYILDEVHEMSKEAFDAMLKLLEEPPARSMFILCTTAVEKVPETVISRCMHFRFRPFTDEVICTRLQSVALKEQYALRDDAAVLLAQRADGSLRDAIGLLEKAAGLCGAEAVIDANVVRTICGADTKRYVEALARWILRRQLASALRVIAKAAEDGIELPVLHTDLCSFARMLLFLQSEALNGHAEWKDLIVKERWVSKGLLNVLNCLVAVQWNHTGTLPGLDSLPLELGVAEAILNAYE